MSRHRHESRIEQSALAAGFTTIDADDTKALAGLAEEGSPCDVAPPFDLAQAHPRHAARGHTPRTPSVSLRNRVTPR